MTLILAEISHDDGFIVADTLLTVIPSKTLKGPFNGNFHALKVHILSKNLCMALAGNYELGLKIINQTHNYIEQHSNSIHTSLFDVIFDLYKNECNAQQKKIDECEFLVMLISTDGNKLTKISNEGIQFFDKTYIGNSEAYKKLQSMRGSSEYSCPSKQFIQQPDGSFIEQPFVCTELEKNFIEIEKLLKIIPLKEKIPSVGVLGDAVTRVRVNKDGNFEYLQQVCVGSSPEENKIGISFLSSSYPPYGIGIFYQAGFGYCWIAGDNEYCRRIDADTIQNFIKKACEEYGLRLEGGTW